MKSVLFACLFFCVNSIIAQDKALVLLDLLNKNINNLNHLEYDLVTNERRKEGHFATTEGHYKVEVGEQKKVFICLKKPLQTTAAWIENEHDNKVHVDVPDIGWRRWSLYNTMFMSNFQNALNITSLEIIEKNNNQFVAQIEKSKNENIKLLKDINFNAHDCYQLQFSNPYYTTKTQKYLAKKDDNVMTIAEKFGVNDIQILESNAYVNEVFDINEGQLVTIPNSFAKTIVIYLDKKLNLPIYYKIEDHKGLLAEYTFSNWTIRDGFTKKEFTYEGECEH